MSYMTKYITKHINKYYKKNGKVVLPHCVAPFVSIWKYNELKQTENKENFLKIQKFIHCRSHLI